MTGTATLRWIVRTAPQNNGSPAWLEDLVAFRGRVLYDRGRRPSFLNGEGQLADRDPADQVAYQVIAYEGGGIAGCFRVAPLAHFGYSLCDRLLGPERTDGALRGLAFSREQAFEGGGWAVDSGARIKGLGLRLFAAGVAVAEYLGYQLMLGACGTRYGQYEKLASTGMRPVPRLPTLPVPKFADELCVVFGETRALDRGSVSWSTKPQLKWRGSWEYLPISPNTSNVEVEDASDLVDPTSVDDLGKGGQPRDRHPQHRITLVLSTFQQPT